MDEATKVRKQWGALEHSILQGKGIDIGCGPDPVTPDVRRFDLSDGDANVITQHVHEDFDFVFSSHCLEHMHDPRSALLEWWKLVRVGGHMIFIIPDEDLYEQGVFPSRFNTDHKATFTLSKAQSWSPVSHNVWDLARGLPGSEVVSLVLQDHGYDRRLMRHGGGELSLLERVIFRLYRSFQGLTGCRVQMLENLRSFHQTFDQTVTPNALAQIQCIVKKMM
jgi:SAM-dependent methyltransferase